MLILISLGSIAASEVNDINGESREILSVDTSTMDEDVEESDLNSNLEDKSSTFENLSAQEEDNVNQNEENNLKSEVVCEDYSDKSINSIEGSQIESSNEINKNLLKSDSDSIPILSVSKIQYPNLKTSTSKIKPSSFTLNEILSAASYVRNFYRAHHYIPSSVTIGNTKVTKAMFLYYIARATINIYNKKLYNISFYDKTLKWANYPNRGNRIIAKTFYKSYYISVLCILYNTLVKKNKAPDFIKTTEGKVSLNSLCDAFSGVLVYYRHNRILPSYIQITTKKVSKLPPKYVWNVSIYQIAGASKRVKNYFNKYTCLPDSVMIGSLKCTMAQFLYYESRAIANLAGGNKSNISRIGYVGGVYEVNMGDLIVNKRLNNSDYVDCANRTYKYILKNGWAPNYSNSKLGRICYNSLILSFADELIFYKNNKKLSKTRNINTFYFSSNSSAKTTSITALANSLKKGKTKRQTAITLFNWVRDYISYSYYYNSRNFAKKTLKVRWGNCCDQTRLYVALCRKAGIKIRYVNGWCHFSDGWYGHVYSEVKVNGRWYKTDTISPKNTFGVIKNWNVRTAQVSGKYTNIYF